MSVYIQQGGQTYVGYPVRVFEAQGDVEVFSVFSVCDEVQDVGRDMSRLMPNMRVEIYNQFNERIDVYRRGRSVIP